MNNKHQLSLWLTPASFFILPIAIAGFQDFNSNKHLLIGSLAVLLWMSTTFLGLRALFKEESLDDSFDRGDIGFTCFLQIACLLVGTALFCGLRWLPG
jgi:hypothetical protein